MSSIIPTIDLSPLMDSSKKGLTKVAHEIENAYKKYGFAYLINHNIPEDLFNDTFNAAKKFHALPLHEKMAIKQNDCFRGYVPLNASTLKVSTLGSAKKPNQLDAFVMAFDPDITSDDYKNGIYLNGDNQFPKNLPYFKDTMLRYRDCMLDLANRLLKPFSIALRMPEDYLFQFFSPPTYFLRLQHYPEQAKTIADDLFGIAPHTDYGFFTILAQNDIEGLDVLDESNNWTRVPFIKNSLILNAGDMLRRMSNDTFKSTKHRVINRSGKERYSIPFFFEPNMRSNIHVAPSCISIDNPEKHKPIIYGEYLMDRIQGNYNLGKRASV